MVWNENAAASVHYQHNDSPHDGDPARPGRYCGPHCDLYEPADDPPSGEPAKPVLSLLGQDGNAFVILGRAQRVLRQAGRGDEVAAFMAEATAGNYDHLLQTCMKWFEVE